MSLFEAHTPPPACQLALGAQIREALARSTRAHAPASDAGAPPPLHAWPVPAAAEPVAPQALAGADAALASLFARCLQYYRTQLRPALAGDTADTATEDDWLAALACFLCACAQSLSGHAVTPERWRAVQQWLAAWVSPPAQADATGADLTSQQHSVERLATLAAAIGEWSVQASRQGSAAIASARLMAGQHLQGELGLDGAALLAAWRVLGLLPGNAPSWDDAELPKAPTVRVKGQRL